MSLGGWSITQETLDFINSLEGEVLLELGSGEGSHELSKRWEVYSIEHNVDYLGLYNTSYIYAPLVKGWYNRDIVRCYTEILKYDVLLIDGPPGGYRSGFLKNIELFNPNVPWVFDDLNRKSDLQLFNKVLLIRCANGKVLNHGEKQIGIIT